MVRSEPTRRAYLATLGCATASALAGCTGGFLGGGGAGGSWPMVQYDAGNTGHAADASGPTGGVGERWRFSSEFADFAPSAVLVDETVYVGDENGRAYAVDATDGTAQWQTRIGGDVGASPAVVDDLVVFGGEDSVVALATDDGDEQWRVDTDGRVTGPLTVADGTAYVGDDAGTCYALPMDGGSEEWTWSADGGSIAGTAVADGTVYVGTDGVGSLVALSAADGSESWRFEPEDSPEIETPPTVANGTVYVTANDFRVYALAASDGTKRWDFEANNVAQAGPAVTDDAIYFGTNDGIVWAVSIADGSQLWRTETEFIVSSSPAVVDDTVYVGSDDTNVYGLATGDGSERWTYETESMIGNSSPAVGDGTVYVTSGTTLYALG